MNQTQTEIETLSSASTVYGLPVEIFTAAIRTREIARKSCSKYASPIRPGTDAYFEVIEALAALSEPYGWTQTHQDLISRIVSPCGRYRIMASQGTHQTGMPGLNPRSTRKRGAATANALSRQTVIVGTEEPSVIETIPIVLLMYRDPHLKVVRSELSLPIGLGSDGHMNEWSIRKILPEVDLTHPTPSNDKVDKEAPIKIDVALKRQY